MRHYCDELPRARPLLGDLNGISRVTLAPALYGEVKTLRSFGRTFSTSETVGNFRARN